MPEHITRRDEILEALREELLGPSPQGQPLDTAGEIFFEEPQASYGPYRQLSGEEILMRDRPTKRYGIGVLSPPEIPSEEAAEGKAEPGDDIDEPSLVDDLDADRQLTTAALETAAESSERLAKETRADDYDYELSSVNAYRPSTMAVSFLAELPEGSTVVLRATGGRYTRKTVKVAAPPPEASERAGSEPAAAEAEPVIWERTWWLRTPLSIEARFDADALVREQGGKLDPARIERSGEGPLSLDAVAYPRARSENGESLITICLVNRSDPSGVFDEKCLFQARFEVEIVAAGGGRFILPYPDPESRTRDEEDETFSLLYRNYETFATGHGCAADWHDVHQNRARKVNAEPLPVFEAPNVTADITLPDGQPLSVPMAALAGLLPGDDGFTAVEQLVAEYSAWIERQERVIAGDGSDPLPERYRSAAARHMRECRETRDRIQDGIDYLHTDADAMTAFRLANHAILLQQLRVLREPRRASYDSRTQRLTFEGARPDPDPLDPPPGRGSWRAFQIAFLLACVRSVAEPASSDREDVDLIWFPTGGGKTEAYLALTAFSLFYRRLRGREDAGVDVLMRYTLRLLTAQQFQRASALMCAMELLRRAEEERAGSVTRLGFEPFSIGIWLGGSVSPNTRADATQALRALRQGRGENKFVLMKCPWCSAQMGPVRQRARGRRSEIPVSGYVEADGSVRIQCPDRACEFRDGLPVFVIDEDIYEHRPSLVIGTVDKFAQLAWRPDARSLFGLAPDGSRLCSPPNLIIQDELHLISGPLGSMVGLYEGLVNALCRAGSAPTPSPPKIVSSTATVRRYQEQVHDLYARPRTRLFPPPGIDASDSFFAAYARLPDGRLSPGRKYVGVHGAGLGSVQTAQVRTFASLLQAPADFTDAEKDPWWSLMVFFNSLRELGTSLSLLQSDIPDYLRVIQNRLGLRPSATRRLRKFLELTGRLRNDEVPKAMEELEVETTSTGAIAVDACLASNIIEVGIDIDRLSLMCVVGQPKTTSQYIQVTGRVGRRWWERPALVVTIYSPSKPRDRSHFEKFRSYHERLYAQVEPTSVTPFSPPVLDRALHAVIAGFARQAGTAEQGRSPYPFPAHLINEIRELLSARVREIDPDEHERFEETFEKRAAEWERWQRTSWRRDGRDGDIGLLRPAGQYATAEESQLSWATPNSLRDVDAECRTQITNLYLRDDSDENV